MVEKLSQKLRDEIHESKKMRHELVMQKFTFSTGLLGIGAVIIKSNLFENIDFSGLLYLVPLVAVAFDFYILSEDYRIKRAGEFLSRNETLAAEIVEWENFCKLHPNKIATFAYMLVTLIFFIGSATIILQYNPNMNFFMIWVGCIISIEIVIFAISYNLRKRFAKKAPKPKENVQ